MTESRIVRATLADVPDILSFIRELADYERLEHTLSVDEDLLRLNLFGPKAYAEVIILEEHGDAPGAAVTRVGFALFFHNFSTFLGKPGIYLEDLFVRPEHRGKGYGKRLFVHLAKLAVERDCGRLDWSVLDWNEPSLKFYASLGAKSLDDWIPQRLTGRELADLARSNAT